MPTDERVVGGHLLSYQDVLSEISVMCQTYNANYILITGDFNTDFSRDSHQTDELMMFCSVEGLNPCVNNYSSSVLHTFENSTGGCSLIIIVL